MNNLKKISTLGTLALLLLWLVNFESIMRLSDFTSLFVFLSLVKDSLHKSRECAFDFDTSHGWQFHTLDWLVFNLLKQLLGCSFANLALLFQISLVANYGYLNVYRGMFNQFSEPFLTVFEALSTRDIVHENRALCCPIVTVTDGTITFLPWSVPHIRLHLLILQLNFLCSELDPKSSFWFWWEALINKLADDGSFSDSNVTRQSHYIDNCNASCVSYI